MPFTTASPPLPEVPDSISIETFMFDENYGRYPLGYSKPPFSDALTGKSYNALEIKERIDHLARALSKELGFKPNEGSEWDKVVACFSLNTVDYLTLAWAVHRLGGILTCANAAYNAAELEYQLKDSKAKAMFTCLPLYETAMTAANKSKIPKDKVYLLPMAPAMTQGISATGHKTVEDFIQAGSKLPTLPASDRSWSKGEGGRRTAFLCYSSGTSGLPKGVMISHKNVIANTLQFVTHEKPCRDALAKEQNIPEYTESCLGLLPFSHIYGLVVINHASIYRGDGVVVLPKYDFTILLATIQKYRLQMLYLIPPMIIHLVNQRETLSKYDLSSVRACFTGAAPLGKETADDLLAIFPHWKVKQGYGLTETSTVVCTTTDDDIWLGSSGSILPGVVCKLVTIEGHEIEGYDQPGELWVKSPSVVLGYNNNDKADRETFVDAADGSGRYMRTGDEAVIKKSPKGVEHVFIVDRIKELIKVKGHQVAPAELEAHLLTHPSVSDCVVIGIPSDREGEVPKAFVVKTPGGSIEESDAMLKRQIIKHVEQHKTDYKRLRGGVEFVDAVPKSPSGKILRRLVRDQEKERRRKEGGKL
ncbi:phenylacetyl-CoA ligase-like protein [Hortaea werneckii]|nr:phenylacetyl-CoA ligase-like protein [Hortaea werneckii]